MVWKKVKMDTSQFAKDKKGVGMGTKTTLSLILGGLVGSAYTNSVWLAVQYKSEPAIVISIIGGIIIALCCFAGVALLYKNS